MSHHHSQFIVLPYCTAAQTRPVPNVALRSPHKAAIECCLGSLGQLFPLPQVPVSHNPCIRGLTLHRIAHKYKQSFTSVVSWSGLSFPWGDVGSCFFVSPIHYPIWEKV